MSDSNLSAFFSSLSKLIKSNKVSDVPLENTPPEENLNSRDSKPSEIIKNLDSEEMIAIEPLYINSGEADAHLDGMTDEEIDKMIDNFNENIDNIKGNIHHYMMVDSFKPIKAYRLPMDVLIGDPEKPDELKKLEEGQPIVKIQFMDNEAGIELWEKRKSRILGGVSIGADGVRIPNPDYEGGNE